MAHSNITVCAIGTALVLLNRTSNKLSNGILKFKIGQVVEELYAENMIFCEKVPKIDTFLAHSYKTVCAICTALVLLNRAFNELSNGILKFKIGQVVKELYAENMIFCEKVPKIGTFLAHSYTTVCAISTALVLLNRALNELSNGILKFKIGQVVEELYAKNMIFLKKHQTWPIIFGPLKKRALGMFSKVYSALCAIQPRSKPFPEFASVELPGTSLRETA